MISCIINGGNVQMKAIIKMFDFEKEVEIPDLRPKICLPLAFASPIGASRDAIGGEVKKLVFDFIGCKSGIAYYALSREQEEKILEAL